MPSEEKTNACLQLLLAVRQRRHLDVHGVYTRDVRPRVTVKRLLEPGLVEEMADKADGAAQDKETVQETRFQVGGLGRKRT